MNSVISNVANNGATSEHYLHRHIELILLLGVSLAIYVQTFEPIESWLFSHWLFDYQHGFTKRGLIGALFGLVETDVSYREVALIGFAIGAVLTLLLGYFAFILFRRTGNPILPVVILSIPCAIPAVGLENARFDSINYIITLTFLLLPDRFRAVPVAILVSALMLLIHEASFFLQLPLIWIAASLDGRSMNLRKLGFLVAASIVMLIAILALSKISISQQEFLSYLHEKLPTTGNALTKEHYGGHYVVFISATENILKAVSLLFSIKGIIGGATIATFAFAWYKLSNYIPGYMDLKFDKAPILLLVPGIAPMLLVGVSVDWYRWCAMLTVNAIAITVFLIRQNARLEQASVIIRAGEKRFKQSTIYVAFLFGILVTALPGWYPGQLKDGLQCLVADYGFADHPWRKVCPSVDFRPKG